MKIASIDIAKALFWGFVATLASCSAPLPSRGSVKDMSGTKETALMKPPTVIEEYKKAWDAAKDNVKLQMMKAAGENLKSDEPQVRAEAIRSLKAKVGLDFSFAPNEDVRQREEARQEWLKYLKNLHAAIGEEIPEILRTGTPRNNNRRAWAAMFLGESAPHPAFLPLLRKMVENEKEDHYVRYQALTSISQIPHQGLIPYLIEQLGTDQSFRAYEQLGKLTRSGIQNDKNNWLDVKKQYKKWWAENKNEFNYQRMRVMEEY